MIISHKYKFIYIGVPKTATNSIIEALTKFKDGTVHEFIKPPYRHSGINTALSLVPEAQDYYKFAFCRNPWDWVISFYTWSKEKKKIDDTMTLSEYISLIHNAKQENPRKRVTQLDHIEDIKNINFLGRFENLQHDYNTICERLNMPCQELRIINKTDHSNYRMYYDEVLKNRVETHYHEDIEAFGYEF